MAKKKIVKAPPHPHWIILAFAVLIVCCIFLNKVYFVPTTPQVTTLVHPLPFNVGNNTFVINDEELTFVNSLYKSVDGKHSAAITNQSINPAKSHVAAILADSPEGSGTFFYLVGGMKKEGKDVYSAPVLLGERIKILSVNVDNQQAEDNGVITVKYLDRASDAPLASEPTVESEKKYAFQEDGMLMEVLH